MGLRVEIKGHGGGVSIDVLGYERPAETHAEDANWLSCTIRVEIGPFRGDMRAALTTHDFVEFEQELRALIDGQASEASFKTWEEALEFKIVENATGTTRITGEVRYSESMDVTIAFILESDQSYLPLVMTAVRAVNKQFPLRS